MKTPSASNADYSPVRDFILLRPEIEPETSEGGIIIPDQARRTLNEGEIIKIGPECSADLKVGHHVVFAAASEYKLLMPDGALLVVVSESNLILTRPPVKKLFPAN